MAVLKENEQEKLWEFISTLTKEDEASKKEMAASLVKMLIGNRLSSLGYWTDFLQNVTLTNLSDETVYNIKEKDLSISKNYYYYQKNPEELRKSIASILRTIYKLSDENQKEDTLDSIFISLLYKESDDKIDNKNRDSQFDSGYFTTGDVAKKLGLSEQSVRRQCEKGRYPDASKTDGGHWRIPIKYFRTTKEQDTEADKTLQQIDKKNKEARAVDEFDLI